jgi:hypothetical protein
MSSTIKSGLVSAFQRLQAIRRFKDNFPFWACPEEQTDLLSRVFVIIDYQNATIDNYKSQLSSDAVRCSVLQERASDISSQLFFLVEAMSLKPPTCVH